MLIGDLRHFPFSDIFALLESWLFENTETRPIIAIIIITTIIIIRSDWNRVLSLWRFRETHALSETVFSHWRYKNHTLLLKQS